jgi:hypothetical protein
VCYLESAPRDVPYRGPCAGQTLRSLSTQRHYSPCSSSTVLRRAPGNGPVGTQHARFSVKRNHMRGGRVKHQLHQLCSAVQRTGSAV